MQNTNKSKASCKAHMDYSFLKQPERVKRVKKNVDGASV